jgi:tRNA isopentenyl-2-thiomethyl-A-37 hydroxylase MiaE
MGPGDLEIWLNHFEHHARHRRRVPRGLSDVLKADERQLIASSIATFQLGERSEGRTLLRAAERFARRKQVPHVVRIFELLIREEQRHASLLRAFMQDHRIPLKKADWTDRVFRLIRRLAGLQLYVSVLSCAELIGKVYYRALESATDCERLRLLCRSIVSDELAHIGFETQLLFTLRAGRAAPLRALTHPAHRIFFTVTAAVVWFTHRSVLRRAGYSGRSFLRSCLAQYAFYLEPTAPSRGLQVSSPR